VARGVRRGGGGARRGGGSALLEEVRAVEVSILEYVDVLHKSADPEQRDEELLPIPPAQDAPLHLHPLHPRDGLKPLCQHERTIRHVEGVRRELDLELVDADAPRGQDLLQRRVEPHHARFAVARVAFVADAQRRVVQHRPILRRHTPQLAASWQPPRFRPRQKFPAISRE